MKKTTSRAEARATIAAIEKRQRQRRQLGALDLCISLAEHEETKKQRGRDAVIELRQLLAARSRR